MVTRSLCAALISLAIAASAGAQDQLGETHPDVQAIRAKPITAEEFDLALEADEAPKVDQLIADISGPDYDTREKAASELIEIGAPSFVKLREAYRRADDLETRLRIEEVVKTAYLNHHVLNRHGFLGISMRGVEPTVLDALRKQGRPVAELPPGQLGVLVENVIPETGAEKAGLQVNDILLSVNGTTIAPGTSDVRDRFSSLIREKPPGSVIELTVLRGSETMRIQAILSRPPVRQARANIIAITPMVNVVSDRFATWWEKYFLQTTTASSPTPTSTP